MRLALDPAESAAAVRQRMPAAALLVSVGLHLALLALFASLATAPTPTTDTPNRIDATLRSPPPEQQKGTSQSALPMRAPRSASAPQAAAQPPELAGEGEAASVDLGAAFATARTIGRAGKQQAQEPERGDQDAPLARAISKSARADCREAHAGWGLLAIPFLIKDTVTDTGCRW